MLQPAIFRRTKTDSNSSSGQIGIIIILIMVVLLTIGLSVASRSVREEGLARQEAESTRVFNAAEAGIEEALSSDFDFQGDEFKPAPTMVPGTNSTVEYSVNKMRVLEARLFEGVSARVQLKDSTVPTPPSVTVQWSKEKNCNSDNPASIIVSVYAVDTNYNPTFSTVKHYAYAACDHGDGMTTGSNSTGDYYKQVTIPLTSTDNFLRIKPVYNDTYVRVTPNGGGTLPVQYYNIRSSATNQFGNENRIVEVKRTIPVAPSVLDYVVFSGTNLVK